MLCEGEMSSQRGKTWSIYMVVSIMVLQTFGAGSSHQNQKKVLRLLSYLCLSRPPYWSCLKTLFQTFYRTCLCKYETCVLCMMRFQHNVRDTLDMYNDRWIAREPVPWYSRSFRLVYVIETLHERVLDACETVLHPVGVFERVLQSMIQRVDACVEARRGHSKHLLTFAKLDNLAICPYALSLIPLIYIFVVTFIVSFGLPYTNTFLIL